MKFSEQLADMVYNTPIVDFNSKKDRRHTKI